MTGKELDEIRAALGWEMERFADALGITRSWLWSIRTGRAKVAEDIQLTARRLLREWRARGDSNPGPAD